MNREIHRATHAPRPLPLHALISAIESEVKDEYREACFDHFSHVTIIRGLHIVKSYNSMLMLLWACQVAGRLEGEPDIHWGPCLPQLDFDPSSYLLPSLTFTTVISVINRSHGQTCGVFHFLCKSRQCLAVILAECI